MKLTNDQLKAKLKTAEGRHMRWQPLWQDCYDFALPNRDDMYQNVPGEDRVSDIYDDTAVQALQDFAGMMHESYFPPFGHIFELMPGPGIEESNRKRLQAELRDVAEEVHVAIHESNAHSEFADAFTDYGIGTYNMGIYADPGPQGLRFQAWPLSGTRLLNGALGDVGFSAFKLRETPRNLKAIYPQMSMSFNMQANMDEPIEVWDIVYRDSDSAMTPHFHRTLVDFKEDQMHSELLHREFTGIGSNPRIHGRFTKSVGEVYGRGPVYNTLASIKTVNLGHQLTLENADMGVGGIWKVPQDGTINPDTIDLVSGTVIPYLPGTRGIEAVNSAVNIDLSQMISMDFRQFIRRGFYVEDFDGRGKTPISSREVQQRAANMKQRLGRPFVRGIHEIQIPTIRRVVYILAAQGRIELPVDVDGRQAQFRIVSPLARVMKADEILRKTDSIRAVNATLGPQQAQILLNGPQIAKDLMELYEQPVDQYIRDEADANSQVDILQKLGSNSSAGQTPTLPADGDIV